MAKGRRTDKPTEEKIRALYASGNNGRAISRELNMPYSTIKSIIYRLQDQKPKSADEKTLAQLRLENQKAFINGAWEAARKGMNIINAKLDAIATNEEMAAAVDMREVSTSVGTMIDKARLASGESTQIVEGQVTITRFEDL